MNNPATLALMPSGWRFDIALGSLGPDVAATVQTQAGNIRAESDADAFYMPALGLVRKHGPYLYGFGVFAQGGMGTEYSHDTWLADPSMGANSVLGEGLMNRSEVSIGRFIVPFTYDVNERLRVGASVDFVWAGIDLQMAMSEAQFQDLANPQAQTIGTASGSLVNTFGQMYEPFGGMGIRTLHHAYFDFSNDNTFTGEARGYGFAGKVGVVYQLRPMLTLGAVYQSKTALGDIETDEAGLSMAVNIDPGIFQGQPTGNYSDMNIPVSGTLTVNDFQWPSLLGFGVAYRPLDQLMLACDVKYITWSNVMKDFSMTFTADDTPENGGFANLEMDATLFQDWDDQAVFSFGGSYTPTCRLTLRTGFNFGKNPVPDTYLNALFPAIVQSHLTFGAGYTFSRTSEVNASVVTALKREEANPGNDSSIPPVISAHSQFNWQVMYTHHF